MIIYSLSHPETDELRYVGKTERSLDVRFKEHINEAKCAKRFSKKDRYVSKWIRSILKAGLKPKIELIESVKDSSSLNNAEMFYIAYFKSLGFKLVNLTQGGDGGCKGKRKNKRSLDHSLNISKSKGGRTFWDQYGNRYSTRGECARRLDISQGHVNCVLHKRRVHAEGYIFSFDKPKELEPFCQSVEKVWN